jgi:LAO/AO transport system kinase
VHELATRILSGDVRGAARAMRLIDDRAPGAVEIMKDIFPSTGKAWVIGVTGNPGSGKSTLCDRLIEHARKRGQRVGVIAVDPTSPYTGGAILGDRIRMNRHATDDGVFIRSVATRGHLGGLSRSARDLVRVLDAFGSDVILVETVGVGQDEIEITRTAHTTLVLMAPGLGDDVQAIKAGLMECADVFAVNKADRDGADATVRDLQLMIALGSETMVASGKQRGHVVHADTDALPSQGAHSATWTSPSSPRRSTAITRGSPRRAMAKLAATSASPRSSARRSVKPSSTRQPTTSAAPSTKPSAPSNPNRSTPTPPPNAWSNASAPSFTQENGRGRQDAKTPEEREGSEPIPLSWRLGVLAASSSLFGR